MQLTLFGIALILVVAWLYLRHRKSTVPPPEPKSTAETAANRYHAVSIKYDADACEAAKAMSGRRFLSSAAPRLPLPDCDATECNCRFAHHKDRRSGADRRSPFAATGFGGGTGSYEKERRSKVGRRRDDAKSPDDY